MIKKYLILISLFFSSFLFAQNKNTEKADQLFANYQFVDAIDEYLELVGKGKANGYVYKRLGDSYYKIFNIKEASTWYSKAVQKKQDAETYYNYAQTLKSQGKYEEANKQLDEFAALKPNDSRAITHLKNPNYIPKLSSDEAKFTVEKLTYSSKEFTDFGPVSVGDELYFVSTRNKSNKKDKWSNQPFLDIFKVDQNGTAEPEPIENLNTNHHDGPVTISKDGKLMVFSKDGHEQGLYKKGKGRTKIAQQGLYLAKKVNGEWQYVKPLSINSSAYSVTHPALSDDGKTLYFASDMPGGLGDTDLWKVSFSENSLGKPENLGDKINTPAKEGFPSVRENVLYFSTNGKQGLGGFDVFSFDLENGEKAENMGAPINTAKDDFSFSMDLDNKNGYFASNRDGIDQLYIAKGICKAELFNLIKDEKTKTLIANAEVAILDEQANKITSTSTNTRGEAIFEVSCEQAYQLEITQPGYETKMVTIAQPVDGINKKEILLTPEEVEITETEVKLDNIYFEFDKSFITQQGAKELDKLVRVMQKYPKMNILVKSHTDSKGSASYNKQLSNERAQATVQYLISKGIAKERLSAQGLGSTEPKIDCGVDCTDEQDAKNRRSEFIIVKKE
ncbi:OmpA family protein [Mesonia aestuariivivens]|uniref:OmpA family protein n=1 Tax=Mesonia aestuariivivens TaxID=2796128 RepID=A0ABS6W4I2_9FLAO|nr:OmpA family protein [Mesonia aestuariivivens]MBW2961994.1 OmpA family protein [Mesonia aestuariivivens]